MSKEKTIKVCTGIGLNMFFPDYVEVPISTDNDINGEEMSSDDKKVKNEKDE